MKKVYSPMQEIMTRNRTPDRAITTPIGPAPTSPYGPAQEVRTRIVPGDVVDRRMNPAPPMPGVGLHPQVGAIPQAIPTSLGQPVSGGVNAGELGVPWNERFK